jgi:O-antigen ligase
MVALLLTNGRSGAIIIMLESIFVFILFNPGLLKFLKVLLAPIILLVLFVQSDAVQPYMESFAEQVEPLSPRLASLILGEEEGDLSQDKSWLHRKLMIDKSLEIFEEFPLLGIGATNFSKFDSELGTFDEDQYSRLGNHDRDWYNNRSAHNTYVQILSEFGAIGLAIFLILLLIPLTHLIKLLFNNEFKIHHLPLISLMGMSIHFYAISTITGAVPWMILGLAIACTYRK